MKNRVTSFYESMYAIGREGKTPSGFLGWLFNRFRTFELHRTPASLKLLEQGQRILDIGCGSGELLAKVKGEKYKTIYGLDVAPVVVNRAKMNILNLSGNTRNTYLKVSDLNEKLPFKANYFDAVTAIAVIEHIFDPYFNIKEINRVLKKKGVLILEVPNLAWLPRRLDVLLGRLPVTGDEEGWDGGHLHYFTFNATSELLKKYGFQIEYMGSSGIFPKIRNFWPSLLGGNIIVKARKMKDVSKN